MNNKFVTQIPEPPLSRFLFADTKIAFIWLILRIYLGYEWIMAGWEKVNSSMWTGSQAGVALSGFLHSSLKKAAGQHPDVSGWYATLINGVALHHTVLISNLVAYGELFIGVLLLFGLFTGVAGFLGAFMNMNYLFAGTVSINPLMFLCELFIILAWRVAGWYGLDRFLLPLLGTPWHPGNAFKKK